ncbi:Bug family tripartite tricarboxylate transporter substrate binding protein [Bordetella petrii]|uniref:Bug family tripartite tricarboxylate transporter substrate binding protein n=1 Tax=Bordetella petrii TaxID=94624 RepID=UPI001A9766ED|nr:tripartite tricarboxylate transporter substrate binding protein [Bordetella petrii]MBO1112596.1 tripartite tricarboxylate transporter substrate binding protein [Bordetella petrii]
MKTLAALGAGPVMPARAAQNGYPARPVRVLVGTAPGGITDFMARLFSQHVGKALGQSFVVENHGGASGTLAAAQAAHAAPDGYTLLATTPTVSIVAPYLFKNLSFSPSRDLEPVCLLGAGPMVLVVNAALPVHDLAELIAYARKRPGQLAYASGGAGSAAHLTGALFASAAGLDLIHVPYKGDGEGVLDVIGGHVPMMFSVMSVLEPHIKSGALRALGVASDTRLAAWPDIPTLAEAGVAGVDSLAWVAIYAPRGTPANVVGQLNAAWQAARQQPGVSAQIAAISMAHRTVSQPAELAAFQQQEARRWDGIIRSAHIGTTAE